MNPWSFSCSIFHSNCSKTPISPGFEQSLLPALPGKVTFLDQSIKPNSSEPSRSWVPWLSGDRNPCPPEPQSWHFSTGLSTPAQTLYLHGTLQCSLGAPHEGEEIMVSKRHANHVNALITLISLNCKPSLAYPAVPGSAARQLWIRWQGIGYYGLPSHRICIKPSAPQRSLYQVYMESEVIVLGAWNDISVRRDWADQGSSAWK